MNTKICSVASAHLALTLLFLAFCVAGCKSESEPAASPEASSSEAPADETPADETPADETLRADLRARLGSHTKVPRTRRAKWYRRRQ